MRFIYNDSQPIEVASTAFCVQATTGFNWSWCLIDGLPYFHEIHHLIGPIVTMLIILKKGIAPNQYESSRTGKKKPLQLGSFGKFLMSKPHFHGLNASLSVNE